MSQLNTTRCSVPPVELVLKVGWFPIRRRRLSYSFFTFTAVANRVLGRGCSPTPYNRDIEPIKRTIITITVPESKTNGLSQRIEPQNRIRGRRIYIPANVLSFTTLSSPRHSLNLVSFSYFGDITAADKACTASLRSLNTGPSSWARRRRIVTHIKSRKACRYRSYWLLG